MVPIANPYVGFEKDARQIKGLWERFNSGLIQVEELGDSYQQMLIREWQRCSALGVDVAMNMGRRLSEAEFQKRRDTERVLLEKSVPIIESVGHYLVDVPGIMILTEGTGSILHICGDPEIRDRAATLSGITEGSQWREDVAGSNGIGTALCKRQPVHVFSSEHFCEGWHTWSCAAAPIFESDGESLLGVVDFTTVDDDYRDQALGLAVSLANSIQAQMTLHRELEKRRLLAVFGDCARRYPNDEIIAFDHTGRPLTHTPTERCRTLAAYLVSRRDVEALSVRETIEVVAPDSQQRIGTIAILKNGTSERRATGTAPKAKDPAPEVEGADRFGDFLTTDPTTMNMLGDLRRIACADVNVLIVGETGTGKELLARHIHASSPRQDQPYIAVNCGAISKELLESAFFGYVRGAFSGADPRGRRGYFKAAAGGTLFLDEVGELPLAMQAALLRVLEDGSYQRVGSYETEKAQCRIIAATNRSLDEEVDRGRFRQDLYYRLNIVKQEIQPLHARPGDIQLLTRQFVRELTRKHGLPDLQVSSEAQDILNRYPWPGNARELRNALESSILCAEGLISRDCLPMGLLQGAEANAETAADTRSEGELGSLREHERQVIISALCRCRKVSRAAKELRIARSTLYRKIAALNIDHKAYL